LTRRDRLTLWLMAGLPTVLHIALVWVTALASIGLAFTTWDGIGFDSIQWVGLQNFKELFTNNPQFWPAVQHNVIWLAVLILLPMPLGMFLAVQLDKKIRFSRVYQTAFFLPVVMSFAVIGFVWQLVYNPDTGLTASPVSPEPLSQPTNPIRPAPVAAGGAPMTASPAAATASPGSCRAAVEHLREVR
jgi:multiple sugar transport system permease protein/raffinose/stachyose/melibiose transport system permease protein